MTIKVDHYFGGYPHCGQTDGCANVGRSHPFSGARTRRNGASARTCSRRDETRPRRSSAEPTPRSAWQFTEVEPLPCTDPEIAGDATQPPPMTEPHCRFSVGPRMADAAPSASPNLAAATQCGAAPEPP